MNAITRIRCSALPSYPDCALRTAVKLWPGMFRDAGYDLRQTASSAGAVVGSSVHAGAGYLLTAKLDGGIGNQTEAEQRALEEMGKRIVDEGVDWDATTANLNAAQQQTRRMVATYRLHIVPKVDPVAVEQRLEADIAPGFILSGQGDVFENVGIRDTKTGTRSRANGAQYGGYSLLRRSQPEGVSVNTITEDFIPRVAVNKDQPLPIHTAYPVAVTEQMAWRIIRRIQADMTDFLANGDALAFLPNPASQLCSEKFCTAWGTPTCRAHKSAK